MKLIWVKKIEGLENIPKRGPIILAANHSSYLDFITMIAVCPRRVTFLTAEVFYKSKFWKPLVVLTGQVKVERKSGDKSFVYAAARSILAKGEVFGIFPEGTRSRSGKLQKAYSGVAKIARTSSVDILPVGIKNAFEVWPPHNKRPHLRKVIEIKFGNVIEVDEKTDPIIITSAVLMPIIADMIGEKYDFDQK